MIEVDALNIDDLSSILTLTQQFASESQSRRLKDAFTGISDATCKVDVVMEQESKRFQLIALQFQCKLLYYFIVL